MTNTTNRTNRQNKQTEQRNILTLHASIKKKQQTKKKQHKTTKAAQRKQTQNKIRVDFNFGIGPGVKPVLFTGFYGMRKVIHYFIWYLL